MVTNVYGCRPRITENEYNSIFDMLQNNGFFVMGAILKPRFSNCYFESHGEESRHDDYSYQAKEKKQIKRDLGLADIIVHRDEKDMRKEYALPRLIRKEIPTPLEWEEAKRENKPVLIHSPSGNILDTRSTQSMEDWKANPGIHTLFYIRKDETERHSGKWEGWIGLMDGYVLNLDKQKLDALLAKEKSKGRLRGWSVGEAGCRQICF